MMKHLEIKISPAILEESYIHDNQDTASSPVHVQWSYYFTNFYFKTTVIIRLPILVPSTIFYALLNHCFKTTCNIRPHFHGPMSVLKIEGPMYMCTNKSIYLLDSKYFIDISTLRNFYKSENLRYM